MNSVYFAFVVHNHQPLGNLPWVLEEAYQTAYLPFLSVLERHPRMLVGIHNTGILLDWYAAEHPEYLEKLQSLVDRGQVEVIGGAYYEPILPAIPRWDQIEQLNRLRTTCGQRLGQVPAGVWLAERVWDPSLPEALAAAEAEYVIVDDGHFQDAGMDPRRLRGYYRTEYSGAAVSVVPIHSPIRQSIPFEPPETTVEMLIAETETLPDRLVVFADDGEKLGSWPGTHQWVYTEGYLDRLFTLIESEPRIHPVLLGDYVMGTPPSGLVYLPTSTYPEMKEWSGGYWPAFLTRYPESNWMHKRALGVSKALRKGAAFEQADASGRNTMAEAQTELLQAQCNCPYWHGVFGGLYLPHLRRETYRHLVRAEVLLESALADSVGPVDLLAASVAAEAPSGHPAVDSAARWHVKAEDVLLMGEPQLRMQSPALTLFLDPAVGGHLVELDDRVRGLNLGATLSRRTERYHQSLDQPSELPWGPDWHRRASLVDHFLGEGATLESFARGSHPEQGDFVLGRYHAQPLGQGLTLSRAGGVWSDGDFVPVRVEKHLEGPSASEVEIQYSVVSLATRRLRLWFGVEFALALTSGEDPDRYFTFDGAVPENPRLGSMGEATASQIGLVDEWAGVHVTIDLGEARRVWRFPLLSLSRSEAGPERIWQGSVILVHSPLELEPQGEGRLALLVGVHAL